MSTVVNLLILVVFGSVIGVWGMSVYQDANVARAGAQVAFVEVERHLRRRHGILSRLLKGIRVTSAEDRELLQSVVDALRSSMEALKALVGEPSNVTRMVVLFHSEQRLEETVERMGGEVLMRAEWRGVPLVVQTVKDLQEVEGKLGICVGAYNVSVHAFNRLSEAFPTSLVGMICGFLPLPAYARVREVVHMVPPQHPVSVGEEGQGTTETGSRVFYG